MKNLEHYRKRGKILNKAILCEAICKRQPYTYTTSLADDE